MGKWPGFFFPAPLTGHRDIPINVVWGRTSAERFINDTEIWVIFLRSPCGLVRTNPSQIYHYCSSWSCESSGHIVIWRAVLCCGLNDTDTGTLLTAGFTRSWSGSGRATVAQTVSTGEPSLGQTKTDSLLSSSINESELYFQVSIFFLKIPNCPNDMSPLVVLEC